MSVVAAVEKDLAAMAKIAPALAESTEAATALALAAEMDGDNSSTSKSMCARVLIDTLESLRSRLPEQEEGDDLDDLAARRAARVARRSAS